MRGEIFLTGPMAWTPLLALLLGTPPPERSERPVTLRGVALAGGDACFPRLVPAEGAELSGLLLWAKGPESFARLAFFAEAIGMTPVPKHFHDGEESGAAVAFLAEEAAAPAAAPWDMASWESACGDIALGAAAEIMGYFGRKPSSEVAGRLPMILSRATSRVAAVAHPAPAALRQGQATEAPEVLSVEAPHEGFYLTRAYTLRQPAFGGGASVPLQREVFVAADAAIVLPYDPARDRLLLVEQFRMGPFGRGDPRPFVLEPVAGRVDAGETPEEAARREAREEAGLELQRLEHVSSHYCSPGCSTEFYHCFLGLADLPETGQGRGGLETENEDIRTHVIGFEQAMGLVASGEANIGPLVLMLLWLERERPRLRAAG
ncbi:MAG: NUDIX domain-containing protein [Roseovarius sp.]